MQREPVDLLEGGDDRGGRHERWRIVLTDQQGRVVADSNYLPRMGGGLVALGPPMAFGKQSGKFRFPIKRYLAPPASGIYQLRLLYHNEHSLAGVEDLEGLVCSQSSPITVRVRNNEERPQAATWIPLAVLVFAPALLFGQYRLMRARRVSLWRDVAWCGMIVAIAAAWEIDQLRLQSKLVECRADEDADWTIEAVKN